MVIYEYTKFFPDLEFLENEIKNSNMNDKNILYSRWDLEGNSLKFFFQNELSILDKTILDSIVN